MEADEGLSRDEMFLSDVHIDVEPQTSFDRPGVAENWETVFIFKYPTSLRINEEDEECLRTDEDGDYVTAKRCDEERTLKITHGMKSTLSDVGRQVWRAALFLSDYLLFNTDAITNRKVLDLGSGTGLTSIVSSLFASQVYCTDIGDGVLSLAELNVHNNTSKFDCCPVWIRELRWGCDLIKPKEITSSSKYDLTKEDVTEILRCDVIMAADVIYDDDATDALIQTLKWLILHGSVEFVYIALEKRLVFTLEDLDIVMPFYKHFLDCLSNLQKACKELYKGVSYYKINKMIEQKFCYKRTKELEIWKIDVDVT